MPTATLARAPRFLISRDDCTAVIDTSFRAHGTNVTKVLCRTMDGADAAFVARTCSVHDDLVTALRAGRVAIDVLMARLIKVDPSFVPTQSAAWPSLVSISVALSVAEA
jgi:hypothetical protein